MLSTILNIDELKKLNHLLKSTNQEQLFRCKKCGLYIYQLHNKKIIHNNGYHINIPSCEEYITIKNMNDALE